MTKIINKEHLAYERGRKMFREGKPCPYNIWSDAEWSPPRYMGQFEWLGWMMGHAEPIMKQIETKRILNIEDNDLDL